VDHFQVDWLHTVDLGIGADILGQLFADLLPLILPNSTHKLQVAELWGRMREFYRATRPPSQLQTLTYEMIKPPSKAAKLRCKAGECRYLIPFGVQLAAEFNTGGSYRNAVCNLLRYLGEIQQALTEEPYPQAECAERSRKLCLLYVSLWKQCGQGDRWRVKPKLHLFQELMEFSLPASPRSYWTYKDEDWGGKLAKLSASRGGHHSAANISLKAVQRYRVITSSGAK
jgi:hypothetical protein